ncbi:MAG: hypothetical protein HY329_23920 [Chloroflexi bacterium]|nr:hypothetical protein [Chloroflexota bacterium]
MRRFEFTIEVDHHQFYLQDPAAYAIPRESVAAALTYYQRNKEYIDARILLNSA